MNYFYINRKELYEIISQCYKTDIITINKDLLAGFCDMLDDKTMETINKCLMAALGLCDIPNPFDNPKPETKTKEELLEEKRKRNQRKKSIRTYRNGTIFEFL